MSMPLNLTMSRGPSVWEPPQARPANWRVYGAGVGALLVMLAMARRTRRRPWAVGLALGIVGASALAGVSASTMLKSRRLGTHRAPASDEIIDENSEASFPASDPPQFR